MNKIIIFLSLLFLSFLMQTEVSARGGCFIAGTKILTPTGDRFIESLMAGDEIMSYNLTTRKQETSIVSDIQIIQRDTSYLINKKVQVTAEHPFYVIKNKIFLIKEVKDLEIGYIFFLENGNTEEIKNIEKIVKKVTVYNLIGVTPNSNYFANGILVHNKGGGGGGGGSGSSRTKSAVCTVSGPYYNKAECRKENYIELSLFVIIMLLSYIPRLARKIYWRVVGKKFTHNQDLIYFTNNIVNNFQNNYSFYYNNGDEIRRQKKTQEELNNERYLHLIGKEIFIQKVNDIFLKYQKDWCNKNFESIETYTSQDFFMRQRKIFNRDFRKGWDMIYNVAISSITPIDIESISSITCQINASMVNFSIDGNGKVTSGNDTIRSFTEYWTFNIDEGKNIKIDNIEQV